MNFRNLRLALAPAALVTGGLLFVMNASASIMGGLFTGSSGSVTVSLTNAFFNPDSAAIGGGNSDVSSGTNLTFATPGAPGCSTGTLQPTAPFNANGCLGLQEGITINNNDLTLTAPSLADANTFMTFAAHPNLVFALNWPPPAADSNTNCATANANGLSCSVFAGSPVLLTYIGGDTEVSLQVAPPGSPSKVSDTGVSGLAASTSTWSGGFSEFVSKPLPNGMQPTPQNIQLYFCPDFVSNGGSCSPADFASGRSIMSSQSGTFNAIFTPTPESSSAVLGWLGLAMLLAGARLRKYYSTRA